MGVEPSFSDNLRPAAVRPGTATNDFTPESEEEVRQSFHILIFRSRHFAMSETILCDARLAAQHHDPTTTPREQGGVRHFCSFVSAAGTF